MVDEPQTNEENTTPAQPDNSAAETLAAAERLEQATANMKAESARLEALKVEQTMSGTATSGEPQVKETAAEYAQKGLRGELSYNDEN